MKALSEANKKLSYFMYKGELWKLVGTWRNKNGTYTSRIKNRAGDIKVEGHGTLNINK